MKKCILIFAVVLLSLPHNAWGWGQTGHDAVAYIAELNLKPSAKRKIEAYLGNRSIVYYSTWMDTYRNTPGNEILNGGHTAFVDDETLHYTRTDRRPNGDAISIMEECWARLKNYKQLDDSTVVKNLYALIHILGDMHCPGHVYLNSMNSAQNKYPVTFMGEPSTYHKVWDSQLIEAAHPKWFYTEWAHQLNKQSKKEIRAVTSGTPRDWFHENAVSSRIIYEWGPKDAKLGKEFVLQAHELAERQIQVAGYRLAYILNDIFG